MKKHRNATHNLSNTKIGRAWYAMMNRCYNKKGSNYKNYGARGIAVCPRWHVIDNFLEDMGHPKNGESIDRIDNDGHYSKENCRWTNLKTQSNNRRTCTYVWFGGKKFTITELSEYVGMPRRTLSYRIAKGMSVTNAVTMPICGKLEIKYKGKIYSGKELADEIGLSAGTIRKRLRSGHSIKNIISNKHIQTGKILKEG